MREAEPETHDAASAPRRVPELFGGERTSMALHEPHAPHGGTCRTGALQRGSPGIGEKMLTQTLREMERGGPLSRRVFDVVPPRMEYSLTTLGCEFIEPVETLYEWGRVYAKALDQLGPRPRSRWRRSTPSGSG